MTKKRTVLFIDPEYHTKIKEIAKERKVSQGQIIRECILMGTKEILKNKKFILKTNQ